MPPSAPKPPQQPPKVTAVVVIREQLGGTGAHGHTGVIERGQRAWTSEDWLPIDQNANLLERISIHFRGLFYSLGALCIFDQKLAMNIVRRTAEGNTFGS